MKICLISGNPKTDGMCQSVIEAAKKGLLEAGAEIDELRLCDLDIPRCHVCGEGWGSCRGTHVCQYGEDGFTAAQERVKQADAIVIATPVYWWETTEALKSFLDRFRRCEFGNEGGLAGKQVLLIASPGGTGNGLLSCFEQLERFCRHTGALVFDYIGVNRWNNDYKREAACAAAFALASGRKNGDTIRN